MPYLRHGKAYLFFLFIDISLLAERFNLLAIGKHYMALAFSFSLSAFRSNAFFNCFHQSIV
jgi:hypothetical protein